jgi:hypothetical protein
MLAGPHSVFEMLGPITGRIGEEDDIGAAVDCITIGVEPDELAILGNALDFG